MQAEGPPEPTVSKEHLASVHALFNKSYDRMGLFERTTAINARSSFDLQLVSELDVVAVLIDLVMCVPPLDCVRCRCCCV